MSDESGVALLEVLIALSILAVAGLSLGAAVRGQARALVDLEDRRDEIERAGQELGRLTLLSRRALDLRLGRRSDGPFVTDVQRPRPTLYRLAVADSTAPAGELVVTVVYRPEGP